MRSLIEGVKVFLHQNCDPMGQHRFQLSAGTQRVDGDKLQPLYHPRAILPREPWRAADPYELGKLVAAADASKIDSWEAGNSVGVFRLSPKVLHILQFDLSSSLSSPVLDLREYERFLEHASGQTLSLLEEELANHQLCWEELEFLRVHSAPPGLSTITMESTDPEHSRLIGLHLDSVDALARSSRHRARSRLCVNMGRETRYLLFVNLGIDSMFNALPIEERQKLSKYFRGPEVGYEFFRRFPFYPVVKLGIAPGECYIAPTDNLIHDASTEGKRWIDMSLHLVGRCQGFVWCPNSSRALTSAGCDRRQGDC